MGLTSKRPTSKGDETRAKIINQMRDEGEKKRRLNADIEDSLYRQIKTRAVSEGRTISEITREMWIEYLSK